MKTLIYRFKLDSELSGTEEAKNPRFQDSNGSEKPVKKII